MKTHPFGKTFVLFIAPCFLTLFNSGMSGAVHAQAPLQTAEQRISRSSANLNPTDIDRIVRAFTAKETEFRRALAEYAFKRDALVQELGMGGQIIGEYHRVSEFTFDDLKTYTKPWSVKIKQFIALNTELMDYFCMENEKDLPHNVGK